MWPQGAYSQHLIFYLHYEWAEWARVLVPYKPFQPSVMYHSSLLDPYLIYKENQVLWICQEVQYSQNLIFFLTYEWVL